MTAEHDTLERLVPDRLDDDDATGASTLALHLERYRFAARHARPGRILDMACGVGYGTRLLADQCPGSTVLGVDVSEHAIAYARQRYHGERVSFRVHDAMTFTEPAGFATVVSLETIEHVPDPHALVQRLVDLLEPGGVLVGSVPTTPSVDVNPHHLHDFTESSFRRLVEGHGLIALGVHRQVHRFNPLPVLGRKERRTRDLRQDLAGYYLRHPGGLGKRIWATLRYGFSNRYLTGAWRKPA